MFWSFSFSDFGWANHEFKMASHQNFITLYFCVLTEITVFFLWHGIKYIPIMFLMWAYLVTTHLCTEFNFPWLCSQPLLYFSPNVFDNCILLLNYKKNEIMWKIGFIYFTFNKIVSFSTVFIFVKHSFHFQIKPEDLLSHNTTLPITCRMCVTVCVCSRRVCIMRDSNDKKYSHKHLMQLCFLMIWPGNLQTARRQPYCWVCISHEGSKPTHT